MRLLREVGTMAGVIVLVHLINENGTEYLQSRFPVLFESDKWKSVEASLENSQEYGAVGVALVSAMPIILHPVIMFCMLGKCNRAALTTTTTNSSRWFAFLAKMDQTVFLSAIFVGRVLKYCLMGYLASAAPKALRFFGVDIAKLGIKQD